MGKTRTYTEEERKQKDAIKTHVWNIENKDKKVLANKTWRENNNNAEYLKKYRRLAYFKRFLSDVCFYTIEKKINYDNRK